MRQKPNRREHDRMRRFEERWREWSHRPPRQDPSQAARQVMARLDEAAPGSASDRGSGSWSWRLAAAAAVVVLAAGLWLLLSGLPPSIPGRGTPAPQTRAGTAETPVMADGVVLMLLDDDTPLYMTFAPPQREPDAEKGEES